MFNFSFSSRWCAGHVYDQVTLTMEGGCLEGPGDQGYSTLYSAFIATPSGKAHETRFKEGEAANFTCMQHV